MASPQSRLPSIKSTQHEDPETDKLSCPATANFIRSLPKARGWTTPLVYKFQNFWCQPIIIEAIINFQTHFKPQPSDVIIATFPKSGTTWLKALLFATMNRNKFDISSSSHPLLSSNPHELVPFLEITYASHPLLSSNNPHELVPFLEISYASHLPDLSVFDSPRLFATHVPYHALPQSVKTTASCAQFTETNSFSDNCVHHNTTVSYKEGSKMTPSANDAAKTTAFRPKVVYVCRNPLDTFISMWNFIKKIRHNDLGSFTMDEAFDMYCNGVVDAGPFWDHMLGYWNEAQSNPERVMFLKYEDMKNDVVSVVKKLSEFVGAGSCSEAEAAEIAKLCSFENLKELEVNKSGMALQGFENRFFFRKGEVGDWVNYLSPEKAARMRRVVAEKLGGSGLSFYGFD